MTTKRSLWYALAGVLLATFIWGTQIRSTPIGDSNDFDQVWFAARTLLNGGDPYALIQPGGPQGTPYPFYYPLTAAVLGLPLGAIPLELARWAFVALGAGVLGYAVGRHRPWLWPIGLSVPLVIAIRSSQWSPLLAAAMFLPSLGFLAAAKPNVGLVILARVTDRRPAILLVAGGLGIIALSLAADHEWPLKWRDALAGAPHFQPILFRPGGFLMLLGLWRWRDPEARMLVALACVPQTGLFYETLPALTVAKTRLEAAILAVLTHLAWNAGAFVPPITEFAAQTWWAGLLSLWFILLPALGMVLYRHWRPRGTV